MSSIDGPRGPRDSGGISPQEPDEPLGNKGGHEVEHHHGGIGEILEQARDAAEEATVLGSSKEGEEVSKEEAIKKRKVLSKDEHNEMIKLKDQYMDLFGKAEFTDEKLRQFLDSLRDLQEQIPENILAKAREQFDDVTVQHAAMEYTLKALNIIDDPSDKVLKENLPTAIDNLMRSFDESNHLLEPQVKAGYTTAKSVKKYSGKLEHVATEVELLNLYRGLIKSDDADSLSGVFKFAHSRLSDANFNTFLEFALKATGEDMSSAHALGPSRDKVRLQSNQDALFMIQALRTAQEKLTEVFTPEGNIDAFDVMNGLFGLMSNPYPNKEQALKIADTVGVDTPEGKVVFMNKLLTFARDGLSIDKEGVWKSLEHREKILGVLNEAATIADNEVPE
tara:strand:- start:24415 stop:25593 length:1179 start_codon:yes stop_codon:yes gene_type:complete